MVANAQDINTDGPVDDAEPIDKRTRDETPRRHVLVVAQSVEIAYRFVFSLICSVDSRNSTDTHLNAGASRLESMSHIGPDPKYSSIVDQMRIAFEGTRSAHTPDLASDVFGDPSVDPDASYSPANPPSRVIAEVVGDIVPTLVKDQTVAGIGQRQLSWLRDRVGGALPGGGRIADALFEGKLVVVFHLVGQATQDIRSRIKSVRDENDEPVEPDSIIVLTSCAQPSATLLGHFETATQGLDGRARVVLLAFDNALDALAMMDRPIDSLEVQDRRLDIGTGTGQLDFSLDPTYSHFEHVHGNLSPYGGYLDILRNSVSRLYGERLDGREVALAERSRALRRNGFVPRALPFSALGFERDSHQAALLPSLNENQPFDSLLFSNQAKMAWAAGHGQTLATMENVPFYKDMLRVWMPYNTRALMVAALLQRQADEMALRLWDFESLP